MSTSKIFNHIVIGGLQRSGTSLLRAIIGSHSDITLLQWDVPLLTKFLDIYKDKKISQKDAKVIIQDIVNHPKIKETNIKYNIEILNRTIEEKENYIYEDLYIILQKHYLSQTNGNNIGIKTPHNELNSNEILKRFPNTKFIHIVRNPLDTLTSLNEANRKWWNSKTNYFHHMKLWQESAEIGLSNSTKYPNNYLLIKYENLILNPEKTIISMCNFLDINFKEEMLQMNNHPGWKGDNSSFNKNKVQSKFSTSSIGRYKNTIKKETIYAYSLLVGKQMNDLGYSIQKDINKINLLLKIRYKLNNIIFNINRELLYLYRSNLYYRILRYKS